ncbi:MAG TPA: glycosyltransferase family 2 protein [Rhodanobacteraceae bacterium]|nr:glycosyltransferase family 2 protein [Rhodanobacteraceae bacterium]
MSIPIPVQPRTLVVIPARNEAATVASVVHAARQALPCDVLVVNDASSDDTSARARTAGARVLDLALHLGAWGAVQAGLRYAHRRGYARVATMDADGQHHAEALPALIATFDCEGAHVLIGSCEQRLSLPKRIAWRYFRALTGLKVRDFTSGMRVYDREALRVLSAPAASLLDYQDIGVLMLLAHSGLAMREVPIAMSPRQVGGSRVFSSWHMVARYMLATTLLCVARLEPGPRLRHGRQPVPSA